MLPVGGNRKINCFQSLAMSLASSEVVQETSHPLFAVYCEYCEELWDCYQVCDYSAVLQLIYRKHNILSTGNLPPTPSAS